MEQRVSRSNGTTCIRMQVNARVLVANLRHAFTSRTTFLVELLQNARRAGATEVHIETQSTDGFPSVLTTLCISDNGRGIRDMQDLLSVAESGWSDEVKAEEGPYGMGFMAALFAAQHVRVESGTQAVEFDTGEAIGFTEIEIERIAPVVGTRIRLEGLNLRDGEEQLVRRYAEGYPVELWLNGHQVPRPDALTVDPQRFIRTEIGWVALGDWGEPCHIRQYGGGGYRAYLAGVPLGRRGEVRNIVHLDPTLFIGRMPDRDTLVNQDEAYRQIDAVIKQLWQERLREEVAGLAPEVVARDYYKALEKWDLLALFNDNPYLPSGVLGRFDHYPAILDNPNDCFESCEDLVHRDQVLSGEVMICYPGDWGSMWQDDSFHVAMYLYLHKVFVRTRSLDKDHWVHALTREIEEEDVSVCVMGGVQEAQFWSGCDWDLESKVLLVDAIGLDGPLGPVETHEQAMDVGNVFIGDERAVGLYEDGWVVLVPENCDSGEVVMQLTGFINEDERFDDACYERAALAFRRFLWGHRPRNAERLIEDLLEEHGVVDFPVFQGRTVRIAFPPSGDKEARVSAQLETRNPV